MNYNKLIKNISESIYNVLNEVDDTQIIAKRRGRPKKVTLNSKIEAEFNNLTTSLYENDPEKFAISLNSILNILDEALGKTERRTWELWVGHDSTWAPTIKRTKYEDYYQYNIQKGQYSYENTTKVVSPGETIINALDKATSWSEGYDRWSRYTCESKVHLNITGNDELSTSIDIVTGKTCKQELIQKLHTLFFTCVERIEQTLLKRKKFDKKLSTNIYGFSNDITNYVKWVSTYVPVILQKNNISKKTWYNGIDIRNAKCEFWTGRLKTLTPDGIIYWVSGDSTDDENKISYSDWNSTRGYKWYSSSAKVSVVIDYEDKEEFSKKIYNYLYNMVRDGKLK